LIGQGRRRIGESESWRGIGDRRAFCVIQALGLRGRGMASFKGIPLPEKLRLIRALVERRTKESFFGRLFLNVQYAGDEVVAGMPEGTIVTIVETYYSLLTSGISAAEAFARIESFRSTAIPGKMPNCNDLHDYVKYRVRLEHKRGRQISDHDIGRGIFITGEFVSQFCISEPDPLEAEIASHQDDEEGDLYFTSELPDPQC
jgi:hypothetical protein